MTRTRMLILPMPMNGVFMRQTVVKAISFHEFVLILVSVLPSPFHPHSLLHQILELTRTPDRCNARHPSTVLRVS